MPTNRILHGEVALIVSQVQNGGLSPHQTVAVSFSLNHSPARANLQVILTMPAYMDCSSSEGLTGMSGYGSSDTVL